VAALQVHWGPLYTGDGWGAGADVYAALFPKKKKKEREKKTNMVEMVSFPFSSFFFF